MLHFIEFFCNSSVSWMVKHTSELKCSFVGIVLKRMEIDFLKCDFNYIFIVLLNPNLIYSLLPGVGLGFVLEKSR